MESSRRDVLNDVAEHRFILKNNQNTCYPCFSFENRYSAPQNGVLCILWYFVRKNWVLISSRRKGPLDIREIQHFKAHGEKWFCYGDKIRVNNIFCCCNQKFCYSNQTFVDRTKHFVVVTKYFCNPYFNKSFCWYHKTFYTVQSEE